MWVAVALVVRVGYQIVTLLLHAIAGGPARWPRDIALPVYLGMTTFSYLLGAVTAVCIAVAVLRYRLFDADAWMSRAIAHVALVVAIFAVYALVVTGVGLVWQPGGAAVVATAAAALLLQPLRSRLTRLANRVVYGRRDDPYTVLSRLGERLADAENPAALLQRLADTVVDELGAVRVEIDLAGDDVSARVIAAAGVARTSSETAFPLRFGGAEVGRMRVWAPAGEPLRAADHRLLGDIATNAATVAQLARTSEELDRSREQLLRAHETERRRLGRDLHDGLGPTVAGLHLRVDTALTLLDRDPARSAELLASARAELVELIAEIRRIVEGLRPAGLDDAGLVASVARAVATGPDGVAPRVRVEPTALPPLPAEVELAAYRITSEAVTNARRHAAGATQCVVRMRAEGRWLRVTIADDGPGIAPGAPLGVGLGSMRERAREVGGSLSVDVASGGGTVVVATLPLRGAPR